MKIIALYLPQFHVIPENEQWWGEGYTEWETLKKGKVLIEGQYQPRIPLNKNYYNLLDDNNIVWQTKIAKEYGVYGFCAYHYWFNGKLLLERPMELFLKNKRADIPFFFCWANHDWDNTIWKTDKKDKRRHLIFENYSKMNDIDSHFYYLLPFFKDSRYMKEDDKPIFCIYNPLRVPSKYLKKMKARWDFLAKKEGFQGIVFTYQWGAAIYSLKSKDRRLFDYGFEYLPSLVSFSKLGKKGNRKREIVRFFGNIINRILPNLVLKLERKDKEQNRGMREVLDYDSVWEDALSIEHSFNNIIPGAFTDWDNSPRHGRNGKVILGANPNKFQNYLERQIIRARSMKKDAIIVFAWNEWTEGGYLEPDEKYGFGYLQAIKNALTNTSELKEYKNCKKVFIDE